MLAIRFLVERTEQGPDGRTFEKGSVHLLRDSSAHHWVKRAYAEFVPHVEPAQLPPDPIVTVEAVAAPVTEKPLPEPPDILKPLLRVEIPDGNSVDSSTEVVAQPDSVSPSIGAKPVVLPASHPAGNRGPSVRSNRG